MKLQDLLLLFDFHLPLCLPEFHKFIGCIEDMDSLIKTDFIKTTFFLFWSCNCSYKAMILEFSRTPQWNKPVPKAYPWAV